MICSFLQIITEKYQLSFFNSKLQKPVTSFTLSDTLKIYHMPILLRRLPHYTNTCLKKDMEVAISHWDLWQRNIMYDEEQGKKFSIYQIFKIGDREAVDTSQEQILELVGEGQQMDGRLCLCPFISGHGGVGSAMVSWCFFPFILLLPILWI